VARHKRREGQNAGNFCMKISLDANWRKRPAKKKNLHVNLFYVRHGQCTAVTNGQILTSNALELGVLPFPRFLSPYCDIHRIETSRANFGRPQVWVVSWNMRRDPRHAEFHACTVHASCARHFVCSQRDASGMLHVKQWIKAP
jgi:hypothetical protein